VDKRKSQRAFVGVTLTTVLSIAIVLIVYAAVLGGPYFGGEVSVGGVTGQITYATTNAEAGPWSNTLEGILTSTTWYAKFVTTGGQYVGPVEITWRLQKMQTQSDWSDAIYVGSSTITNIVLDGSAQPIFATSDGLWALGQTDWHTVDPSYTTTSYRVAVTISSTG